MTGGSTTRHGRSPRYTSFADIHTTNKYLQEDREEIGRQQLACQESIQEQTQPTGVQVHVDAAINQVPARYEARKAGLGVHTKGRFVALIQSF
jgi:epoxyqueuosine reductase QueG